MEDRIRAILSSHAGLSADAAALSKQDDLYQAGMKSLTTIKLMLALENEFHVEFPESMLHLGVFSSIATIAEAVTSLMAGQALCAH